MSRLGVLIALSLVGIVVLAPIGAMVAESLLAFEVVTDDGESFVGFPRDQDHLGVTLEVYGEVGVTYFEQAEIRSAGRVLSVANYRSVLAGAGERNMLLATLALAGASTLLALLIGLPLGLLFAATDLPGRRFLEGLSILPLVLPPILLAIAGYYDLLHLKPEFLRAVAVFGFSLFPLVSLLTARAVRAGGAEALETARVHAGTWEALLRAGLRPALPGAAAGALLVFVFVVSDFAVPDFLGVTTAQNTITVYANAVFRYWAKDGNAGAATAAGMPATLLAIAALVLVLVVESRRDATTVGTRHREIEPLPLKGWRWPLAGFVAVVFTIAVLFPLYRHIETAGGAHYGNPVSQGGAAPMPTAAEAARAPPTSVMDGLRKGVNYPGIADNVKYSLILSAGGALLALLLAIALVEAGRRRPKLDRFLVLAGFLPVAVPPMVLAVGWVKLFGSWTNLEYFPVVLLGARLLPFATFAVRAARRQVAPELIDSAAVAGLGPTARLFKITLPLIAAGAAQGFMLAFLFGLREVDAVIFTKTGAQTLPVKLYGMIHAALDVQVAGLAFLWTCGIAGLLIILRLLIGSRLRLVP